MTISFFLICFVLFFKELKSAYNISQGSDYKMFSIMSAAIALAKHNTIYSFYTAFLLCF